MPFITIPFTCILFSFLIGYLGRNRKMGFWGYFFATLLFTPFVGAILMIASDDKKTDSSGDEE